MTSETLTIEALERWVDSGAHSQVVETSNNRIAVDLWPVPASRSRVWSPATLA
jgi:hypothetical protein